MGDVTAPTSRGPVNFRCDDAQFSNTTQDEKFALVVEKKLISKGLNWLITIPHDLLLYSRARIIEFLQLNDAQVSKYGTAFSDAQLDEDILAYERAGVQMWKPCKLQEWSILTHEDIGLIPLGMKKKRMVKDFRWSDDERHWAFLKKYGPITSNNSCAWDTVLVLMTFMQAGILHFDTLPPQCRSNYDSLVWDFVKYQTINYNLTKKMQDGTPEGQITMGKWRDVVRKHYMEETAADGWTVAEGSMASVIQVANRAFIDILQVQLTLLPNASCCRTCGKIQEVHKVKDVARELVLLSHRGWRYEREPQTIESEVKEWFAMRDNFIRCEYCGKETMAGPLIGGLLPARILFEPQHDPFAAGKFSWQEFQVAYRRTTRDGTVVSYVDTYKAVGFVRAENYHYWLWWDLGGDKWVKYDGMPGRNGSPGGVITDPVRKGEMRKQNAITPTRGRPTRPKSAQEVRVPLMIFQKVDVFPGY